MQEKYFGTIMLLKSIQWKIQLEKLKENQNRYFFYKFIRIDKAQSVISDGKKQSRENVKLIRYLTLLFQSLGSMERMV